jgi:hypothetical protein
MLGGIRRVVMAAAAELVERQLGFTELACPHERPLGAVSRAHMSGPSEP